MLWSACVEGGPRRVNHAAVAIDDKIYSFGGYCSGETNDVDQPIDVHMLDTDTLRWSRVRMYGEDRLNRHESSSSEPSATDHREQPMDVDSDDDEELEEEIEGQRRYRYTSIAPYQRYGHTVVAYKGKAYLWGGRSDEYGASATLHEFDPATNRWRVMSVAGKLPPARDGHSAVISRGKMYLFGGFEEDSQRFSQETYVLDMEKMQWHEIQTTGAPPIWRDFHTAAVIDHRMYVFGGRSDQMGQYHSTRDVYCERLKVLDLATGVWSDLETDSDRDQKPGGRRSHSSWVFDGRMYIFGGYLGTKNVHYNDMYSYDPVENCWQKHEFAKSQCSNVGVPSARRRQCTVVVGSRVFLFGGTKPLPGRNSAGLADLDDLYVLEYEPSLLTLAARCVLDKGISEKINQKYLPRDVWRILKNMTVPNEISSSLTSRHEVAG